MPEKPRSAKPARVGAPASQQTRRETAHGSALRHGRVLPRPNVGHPTFFRALSEQRRSADLLEAGWEAGWDGRSIGRHSIIVRLMFGRCRGRRSIFERPDVRGRSSRRYIAPTLP
jgi:hypothetical protein